MWKESLRIGIDIIDEQHKALFDKIEELRKAIHDDSTNSKQNCIDAIVFLKDYTVKHFADEEAYQQSIGYKRREAHKKLHEGFIKTLREHEKKLNESDFAERDVKEFTGMLVAWLLYHVADADQKIGKETVHDERLDTQHEMTVYAIKDVLSKMAGYNIKVLTEVDTYAAGTSETVAIEVELEHDTSGFIIYTYPITFVKDMISSMMGYTPSVVGEMELSALFEISNIISGTVCRQISYSRNIVSDISSPFLAERARHKAGEKIAVDTGCGILEAEVSIEYK